MAASNEPARSDARFADRTYFITGVARGQGRAHALRLASEGAAIIGVDLCADVGTVGYPPATPEDLDATIAEVEAAGGKIIARVADVRDQPTLGTVLDEGTEAFGRLDGVIANAGICSYGRLWELSDEQWQSVIDTNLTGVFHTLRATVPLLLDHDNDASDGHGGSIVITTSGAGIKPLPLLSHYSASKAGVIAMARSLAHEVAAHHVRVNVVAPTAVTTPMGKDATLREVIAAHPEATAAFGNLLPIGSVEPEDITEAVTWLLSDAARYVTGVVLPVDAGTTIR
jgi:SDR family mycofactocin-dependent oxidoreductase